MLQADPVSFHEICDLNMFFAVHSLYIAPDLETGIPSTISTFLHDLALWYFDDNGQMLKLDEVLQILNHPSPWQSKDIGRMSKVADALIYFLDTGHPELRSTVESCINASFRDALAIQLRRKLVAVGDGACGQVNDNRFHPSLSS